MGRRDQGGATDSRAKAEDGEEEVEGGGRHGRAAVGVGRGQGNNEGRTTTRGAGGSEFVGVGEGVRITFGWNSACAIKKNRDAVRDSVKGQRYSALLF